MTSKMMKRWTMPRNYMGEEWPHHYMAIGYHRDSGLLDESNFKVFIEAMRRIDKRDNWPPETHWQIVRETHWAVGWVEWLGIHQNAQAHIERADQLLAQLADYFVLDEDDYGDRQYKETLRGVTEAVSLWSDRNFDTITEEQKQAAIDTLINECEDIGGSDGEGYYPSDEEVELAFYQEEQTS